MAELLAVVDGFRSEERALRRFYGDIWNVQKILFVKNQTKSGAKRQLGKLRKSWEKRLLNPKSRADIGDEPEEMLSNWCNQTDSYWPGLFHTYGDFRIPGTSNDIERHIKEMKQLVRNLSRNPNPAQRFIRHAATNAIVSSHPSLPDAAELAIRSTEQIAAAKKQLADRRRSLSATQLARRNPKKYREAFVERWKQLIHKSATDQTPIRGKRKPS